MIRIDRASADMLELIRKITQETISEEYPRYYPSGAVQFFKNHHSDSSILADIGRGNVYVLFTDGIPAATVTVTDNHIERLFVLCEFQHQGYGRALLDFAENMIAEKYDEIELDVSLPAKHIYLKRGYREAEYHQYLTDSGDYLCYDVMKKTL